MNDLIIKPTFGTDVEYFACYANGSPASAEGIIPGTKQAPEKFVPGDKFFATQLDNVLAEGNIPPHENVNVCVKNMMTLRSHMNKLLKPHDLHLSGRACATLPDKYLQTENAKTFGCDASYNCWTQAQEAVTPSSEKPNLRTAGFHIHVGYEKPTPEKNLAIARSMDLMLGVTSVLFEPDSDRRVLGYGKAGNFRHQPHGVEYRTLSSFWADTPKNALWAFTMAYYAVMYVNQKGVPYIRTLTEHGDAIQKIINTHDVSGASALLAKFGALHRTCYFPPNEMYIQSGLGNW